MYSYIGRRRTEELTTDPHMLNAFERTESFSERGIFCRKASCTLESRTLHVQLLKGTVLRDFLLLVFFMNQFPPSPRVSH